MSAPIDQSSIEPLCNHALWDGVTCELPRGHIGSHERAATEVMAALTWRSRTTPPPLPAAPQRVDYLELLRASKKSA